MSKDVFNEKEKFILEQKVKLDEWFQNFVEFEKLRFKDAKSLYLKMLETHDDNEKKIIRTKIICGTINNIYEYLCTNNFIYLCNDNIDITDIINDFVLEWILAIDNGYLLKKTSYTYFFYSVTPKFTRSTGENFLTRNNIKLSLFNIIDLLGLYISKKNTNGIVNKNDFTNILKEVLLNNNFKEEEIDNLFKCNNYYIDFMYNMIKYICNIFENSNMVFNRSMLENYIMAFINNSDDLYFKDELSEIIDYHNFYEQCENRLYVKHILKKLKPEQRRIIMNRYGINNRDTYTLVELAQKTGSTKSNVNQIEHNALKRLKKNNPIK